MAGRGGSPGAAGPPAVAGGAETGAGAGAGARAGAAVAARRSLTWRRTSASRIRPLRPVPVTSESSAPELAREAAHRRWWRETRRCAGRGSSEASRSAADGEALRGRAGRRHPIRPPRPRARPAAPPAPPAPLPCPAPPPSPEDRPPTRSRRLPPTAGPPPSRPCPRSPIRARAARLPARPSSPRSTRSSATTPRRRRGDVHRRLVALQGEERVVELDPVPGGDQELDHRHPGEVSDVRNEDLDPLRHDSSGPPRVTGPRGAHGRDRRGSAGWRRGRSRRGAARRRPGP